MSWNAGMGAEEELNVFQVPVLAFPDYVDGTGPSSIGMSVSSGKVNEAPLHCLISWTAAVRVWS